MSQPPIQYCPKGTAQVITIATAQSLLGLQSALTHARQFAIHARQLPLPIGTELLKKVAGFTSYWKNWKAGGVV